MGVKMAAYAAPANWLPMKIVVCGMAMPTLPMASAQDTSPHCHWNSGSCASHQGSAYKSDWTPEPKRPRQ